MTVQDVQKDLDRHQMKVTAEFDAPVERVWQLWADPRQLERWWGPPTYPATVVDHDLTPGGRVTYFMTSPEGDRYHGYWRVNRVDAPTGFEFTDGFADETGAPNDEMPTSTAVVTLTEVDGGTRMEVHSTFASREAMERSLAMGVEEGMRQALGQIDGLLAAA